MGITVKEYSKEHGISLIDAEAALRRKVEAGEFRRHRNPGLPWVYERILPIKFHDPFKLGATHEKRRRLFGPNMQYKYGLREEQ
jgi:hypothetical protein